MIRASLSNRIILSLLVMKANQPKYLFIMLLLVPLLSWGHGDRNKLVLSGIISNSNGSSVEGAEISIERNGEVIQSTRSNADGSFEIKLDQAYYRLDHLEVRVRKNGFKPESLPAILCPEHRYDVHLDKAKTTLPIIQRFGPPQVIVI